MAVKLANVPESSVLIVEGNGIIAKLTTTLQSVFIPASVELCYRQSDTNDVYCVIIGVPAGSELLQGRMIVVARHLVERSTRLRAEHQQHVVSHAFRSEDLPA